MRSLCLILAVFAALFGAANAHAVSRYWVGPTGGLWSDPANWSATPGGPGGAGVPQVLDAAVTPSGISAHFDYVYGQPGIGVLNMNSPVLIEQDSPSSVFVGGNELRLPAGQTTGSGTGRYVQSAGTCGLNTGLRLGWVTEFGADYHGFYNLSNNAVLSVRSDLLATNGLYTQTGGQCTITQRAILGDPIFEKAGGIDMSGGSLDIGLNLAQRWGASTFSGGVTTIGTSLSISQSAMVTLSGGNVSTASVNLFGAPLSPQLIQNGGVLTVANQINVGTACFYRFNAGAMSCASLSIGALETGMGEIGRFLVGPGADKVVRTRSINFFANGKMDLNQAAMVVDYDTGSPSPLGGIRDYIVTGFNGGSWNGNGGIGSSFAASNPGHAIGYAEASALGSIPAIFGAVDGDTVLIRTTRLGDADLSGSVNLDDFNRLAANFGMTSGAVWSQGDFNYDAATNLGDFNLMAGNFGLSASPGGPTPQDWAALAAVIPEPIVVLPLVPILLALPRRRHGDFCERRNYERTQSKPVFSVPKPRF